MATAERLDYAPLLERFTAQRFALLGEASHGTHEFYRDRAEIYRPETERFSHYFHARLATQFDAVIHIDETRALEPLELTSEWEAGELPETYPFAV